MVIYFCSNEWNQLGMDPYNIFADMLLLAFGDTPILQFWIELTDTNTACCIKIHSSIILMLLPWNHIFSHFQKTFSQKLAGKGAALIATLQYWNTEST